MKNTGRFASIIIFITLYSVICSCEGDNRTKRKFIEKSTVFASGQTIHMLGKLGNPTGENYPVTIGQDGGIITGLNHYSGFFPGSLWYIYELTGAKEWKETAENWTTALDPLKYFNERGHSNLTVNCSYGNALRLVPNLKYSETILQVANLLTEIYNNHIRELELERNIKIRYCQKTDNRYFSLSTLDNLELLFTAHKIFDENRYYQTALSYADAVFKEFFNEMSGSFNDVRHSPDGKYVGGDKPSKKCCDDYQNVKDNALALYGFTMIYRETGEARYLEAAVKAANTYITRLPDDLIPYCDTTFIDDICPQDSESPICGEDMKHRDTSAAAIACSALFDLSGLSKNVTYKKIGVNTLHSLSSPEYRAKRNTNGGFLLIHSAVCSRGELFVDVSIAYADYYFLEALVKYKKMP